MEIKLYRESVVDRLHCAIGPISSVEQYLLTNGGLLLNSYTSSQSMRQMLEYVDVPLTPTNKTVNYVVIKDDSNLGEYAYCFFVDRVEAIAVNVLRVFITLDSLTSFFRKDTEYDSIIIKRTNCTSLYTDNDTLSIDDITNNVPFVLDETQGIYVPASEGLQNIRVVAIFEATSTTLAGEVFIADVLSNLPLSEQIYGLSKVDRVSIDALLPDKTINIKLRNLFALPTALCPNSNTQQSIAFYGKNEEQSSFTGFVYRYGNIFAEQFRELIGTLSLRPENDYRIGTFTNYVDLENPSVYGNVQYSIRCYADILSLRVVVRLFNIEYDITNGLELPLVDAVAAAEINQKKTNAVIANSLSILGQVGAIGGAIARGDALASVLGVGNIGTSIASLVNYKNERITGGLLTSENAALVNLKHGFYLGVQVKNRTNLYAGLITRYGYKMFQYFLNALAIYRNNFYWELVAKGLKISLQYEPDIIQRLNNGVYIRVLQ